MSRTEDEVAQLLQGIFELDYKKYFLFCGAIEPKKNVSRLVDAYLASGTDCPLVIAGGLGWDYEQDLAKIERKEYLRYRIVDSTVLSESRVRRFGHIPYSHLITLIQGARALLFPSLYEGFGLPVLEAMLLGTPVLTSNVSSLPEVAGGAALFVDPLETTFIAQGIRRLDRDKDLRYELKTKGIKQASIFSEENYRKTIQALYSTFA